MFSAGYFFRIIGNLTGAPFNHYFAVNPGWASVNKSLSSADLAKMYLTQISCQNLKF